jgi:hypothetical protein
VRTAQYVAQEQSIAAADVGGIRERWLWGLRILHDSEKMSSAGGGLKHGAAADLIAAAKARGFDLTQREIQSRIQCAKAYQTESQIRRSTTDFRYWSDLIAAHFPVYEPLPGEPPADYRTRAEQKRDRARDLADYASGQLSLIPLDKFEPTEALVKELRGYCNEQKELTGRFVERDRLREEYVSALEAAVDGDESATWAYAHRAAFGDDSDPAGDVA